MVKTCTLCDQAKPLDDFPVDARRNDGRASQCRACRAARYQADPDYTARYRDANREALSAKQTARYREHQARITALKLTLACVDCGWQPTTAGEAALLEFDHIDPDTKHQSGTPAYLRSWAWERIAAELALCEPRCNPCHVRRTTRLRHNLRRRTAS